MPRRCAVACSERLNTRRARKTRLNARPGSPSLWSGVDRPGSNWLARWRSLPAPGLTRSTARSIRTRLGSSWSSPGRGCCPRSPPSCRPTPSGHCEKLGVEVRTGAKVTHIDPDGVEIDGDRIAARTTFWVAGVAASPAARWLGQPGDKSGRIPVGEDLSVPGCSGVFAIGDTAASIGWAGAGVPGLAPTAKQQGRHAAGVIWTAIHRRPAPSAFRYRHYRDLATIGRLAAVVELRKLRLWGAPAWWLWGFAHVLLLSGGRNRAAVALNWLWAYLTFRRGTRLITGSAMDLRHEMVSGSHR